MSAAAAAPEAPVPIWMASAASAHVHLLGGALAAVHLPGLFREGAGIERVAAAVACASTAFTFSIRRSIMYNEARDQKLLDEAREAAEAALRTGRLDVMREILAKRPKRRPRAAATARPRRARRRRRRSTSAARGSSPASAGPGRDRPDPYGADTNANRRLHLLNGHLVGVLEYLFPPLRHRRQGRNLDDALDEPAGNVSCRLPLAPFPASLMPTAL
eukprot:tig00020538_g10386.t1